MVSDGGATASVKSGPLTICTPRRAMREPAMPGAVPVKTPLKFCGEAFDAAVTVRFTEPPGSRVNAGCENVRPGSEGAVTVIVPANPLTPVADTLICVD